MLMALDIPLPKKVFGHPWVLINHNKMSKSKNNVIYADTLVDLFGVDAVRYYVLHEIPFAQDGNITYELVTERTNSDLANTLGNLVNRTIAMVKKYFGDDKIFKSSSTSFDEELFNQMNLTIKNYKNLMDQYKIADGLEEVMNLLRQSNKYIDETQPWVLAKDEAKKEELRNVLYNLLEAIRLSAVMLEPAMPFTSKKIYEGLNTTLVDFDNLVYNAHKEYLVKPIDVLFKRLDVKEVMDKVMELEKEPEVKAEPSKPEITIDDFDKLELVVGKIIDAKPHPKAEKLLVFKVDVKTDVRQIVSGIAKYYKPEELIGRKVVVVKNLKPIKLRGEDSNGMLLCASKKDDSKLELISIEGLEPGDIVS